MYYGQSICFWTIRAIRAVGLVGSGGKERREGRGTNDEFVPPDCLPFPSPFPAPVVSFSALCLGQRPKAIKGLPSPLSPPPSRSRLSHPLVSSFTYSYPFALVGLVLGLLGLLAGLHHCILESNANDRWIQERCWLPGW